MLSQGRQVVARNFLWLLYSESAAGQSGWSPVTLRSPASLVCAAPCICTMLCAVSASIRWTAIHNIETRHGSPLDLHVWHRMHCTVPPFELWKLTALPCPVSLNDWWSPFFVVSIPIIANIWHDLPIVSTWHPSMFPWVALAHTDQLMK